MDLFCTASTVRFPFSYRNAEYQFELTLAVLQRSWARHSTRGRVVYYYWRAAISTAAKSPAEEAVSGGVHRMEQYRRETHLATGLFFKKTVSLAVFEPWFFRET